MAEEKSVFGEALLTEKDAANLLSLSPRFLQVRRHKGNGPRFIKISSRAVRYRPCDLQEWIEERVRTSTADDGNNEN